MFFCRLRWQAITGHILAACLLMSFLNPSTTLSETIKPNTLQIIFSNNMDAEHKPCGS